MTSSTVLIAGAGIGGLTAAAMLLLRGIDAEVHEQSTQLGEVGAGIQISANAARVYQALGMLERLRAVAAQPRAYRFRLFDHGEVLQSIVLGDTYEQRHGVPYLTVHRADLHALLVERVRELKADTIHLGHRVERIDQDADGVALHFADGSRADGRLLIGGDGIKSVVRDHVIGAQAPRFTGDASWRLMVAMEQLPAEHRQDSVDIWVGPGKHAVTYPLRRGEVLNMVGCVEQRSWDSDSWISRAPWEELDADFRDWNDSIAAVVALAREGDCYRWAMNDREPITGWTRGRATLMGDAAHPTLPYMAQGAAMAVEDAAVLARAIARDGLEPAALHRYERHRVERTARIVRESAANRALFHMDSVQALRDAFARRDMSGERNAWLFSYDPIEVPID
jgi:salicylate hydroxylase